MLHYSVTVSQQINIHVRSRLVLLGDKIRDVSYWALIPTSALPETHLWTLSKFLPSLAEKVKASHLRKFTSCQDSLRELLFYHKLGIHAPSTQKVSVVKRIWFIAIYLCKMLGSCCKLTTELKRKPDNQRNARSGFVFNVTVNFKSTLNSDSLNTTRSYNPLK